MVSLENHEAYFSPGDSGASGTDWSSLSELSGYQDPAATERQGGPTRQQRKIIAALGWPAPDGHPNMEYINYQDVSLNPGAKEMVLDKFRTGAITDQQERELIGGIKGPLDQKYSERAVFQSIRKKADEGDKQSERELRIVGYMMGGAKGFGSAQENVNESYIITIYTRYNLPQDFLAANDSLLDNIGHSSGPKKREAYSEAVHDLAHRIYGKKYEYFVALNKLKEEAFSGAPNQYQGPPSRSELEHSSEWISGESGSCQVSRAQTRSGRINKSRLEEGLIPDESCQDAELIRSDQQLYGVFDGAGGEKNGRAAAILSSRVVNEFCDQYVLQNGSHLAWVLNRANETVYRDPSAGYSTAVLTKVIEDGIGGARLAYAVAGDSRIYIVKPSGEARLITNDESVNGNQLTNYLGRFDQSGEFNVAVQYGDINLSKGDKIVLCSDGITGDRGSDLMSEAEVGEIVSRSRNPEDAAKNLVSNARKIDDRTAIVVAV